MTNAHELQNPGLPAGAIIASTGAALAAPGTVASVEFSVRHHVEHVTPLTAPQLMGVEPMPVPGELAPTDVIAGALVLGTTALLAATAWEARHYIAYQTHRVRQVFGRLASGR